MQAMRGGWKLRQCLQGCRQPCPTPPNRRTRAALAAAEWQLCPCCTIAWNAEILACFYRIPIIFLLEPVPAVHSQPATFAYFCRVVAEAPLLSNYLQAQICIYRQGGADAGSACVALARSAVPRQLSPCSCTPPVQAVNKRSELRS